MAPVRTAAIVPALTIKLYLSVFANIFDLLITRTPCHITYGVQPSKHRNKVLSLYFNIIIS